MSYKEPSKSRMACSLEMNSHHKFLPYSLYLIFLKDEELIFSNKITHIINCAANDLPNNWENEGIVYLSFYWEESDSQVF